jgi:predicted dehydrogenase
LKFIVIGCGSIGSRHIKNLLDLGHEILVWNRGAARREQIGAETGVSVFSNLRALLSEEKSDATLICTPSNLHVEHALLAAEHGHNLFIEKPVACSLDKLDDLQAVVQSQKLLTHVAANMRFHLGPARLKEIVDEGVLGKMLWANFWGGMRLPDWHPTEDYRQMYSSKVSLGGGALLDFIHELDLAVWFFGPPTTISSSLRRSGSLEIETEDLVDSIWMYENGPQLTLHLDYLQRPFQRGIRILGEKGWAEWNLSAQSVELFLYESGSVEKSSYKEKQEKSRMYVNQASYFMDCLQQKRESTSNLEAGTNALRVALRMRDSSRLKQFN